MTAKTDASTGEKGALEDAFSGATGSEADAFAFLKLPAPAGQSAPAATPPSDESADQPRLAKQEADPAAAELARKADGDGELGPVPTAVSEGLPEAIQAALTAELPESGKPAEVITACERRLHAALTLREAMEKRSLQAYFHYAGPAVRLAHRTESWKHIVDPATGKPCRSWSAWLRTVKVSRQHAFRMVKVEPLMEALSGLDTGPLGVRQIDVLSPVLTRYGQDKVRELWEAASAAGDVSATGLARMRDQLNLTVDPELDESGEPSRSQAPVLRFQVSPGTFDEGKVREAARAQPHIARLVATTILQELGEEPTEG